jgi:type VI secretion system ImpA family protein
MEARLAPLLWVVDRLPMAVKRIPVTAPTGEDSSAYGWLDWEAGLYLTNLSRLDAAAAGKAQERGMVPQDRFLVSVSLTPAPWLAGLAGELARALAALDGLDAVLAGCCGEEAPSLSSLRGPLTAVQAFVTRVLEERGEPLPSGLAATGAGGGVAGGEPAATGEGSSQARPAGAVLSRSEAYQHLAEAADFLLRTEPHSPVPYLVRRAVAWGNLSLAELLQELLQKNSDLATLYTLLGIKRTS